MESTLIPVGSHHQRIKNQHDLGLGYLHVYLQHEYDQARDIGRIVVASRLVASLTDVVPETQPDEQHLTTAPLGFAIVGCGRIAQRYLELLTGPVAGARLITVCDVQRDRVEAAARKGEVPGYVDMHEMMRAHQSEIDVVCILTESGHHAVHAIALAQYGKHLLVEKPMALTLDDAQAMIVGCDRAGVRLFVVKQNRYNLPVIKLREALESGRFGKIVMGSVRVRWCRPQSYYDQDAWRGTWALDGGVFSNQASHHIDLLMWMLGEPMAVFAKTRTALVNIEAEDTGVAVITFRNGAIGVVEATTATRPKDLEGSLSVLGENGTVEIGGFAVNRMRTWQFVESHPEDEEVLGKFSENPPNVYGFGHQRYLEGVVSSLRCAGPRLVDGIEGMRSLELIVAMYESAATGKEVPMRFRPSANRLGRSR
jgi:UDP-N-acetyl-2-amino-2-deoxyglucuronate dehydrogenase